jgi:hypothetical protein
MVSLHTRPRQDAVRKQVVVPHRQLPAGLPEEAARIPIHIGPVPR